MHRSSIRLKIKEYSRHYSPALINVTRQAKLTGIFMGATIVELDDTEMVIYVEI